MTDRDQLLRRNGSDDLRELIEHRIDAAEYLRRTEDRLVRERQQDPSDASTCRSPWPTKPRNRLCARRVRAMMRAEGSNCGHLAAPRSAGGSYAHSTG